MTDVEALQAENEKLRAEVDGYKQREVADLRAALAAVTAERDHYRNEAFRNAEIGRQIDANAQQQISDLKARIDAMERSAIRGIRSTGPIANASRN